MRMMKDSGKEWFGEIPASWAKTKAKYLFNVVSGSTPASDAKYWDGEIAWITPADYKTKDRYVFAGKRNLSELGYKSCSATLIPQGSIIFSKRAPIGTVAVSGSALCTNQGCLSCVPKALLDSEYYYFVMSIGTAHFELLGTGTTFKEISADNFSNCTFPLPPVEKQTKISTYLQTVCDGVDALTADIQAQIDTLEQYKRSVIAETVTKGLNPDVEMKESGIEWVGAIPMHWRVMPNKYLMYKEKIICPVYSGEDILSLTMNGVIVRDLDAGGKMPKSFDGYQIVHKGNLLMCLFDIDVTPRCVGIINDDGLTSPAYSQFILNDLCEVRYYYYYYLMIDFTKELLHMAKNLRHSLTEEQLGAISAPVPPLDEQLAISDYLDSKVKEINEIIATKKSQLEIVDTYKKSLIFEYVTGKKEVPNL